MTIQFHGNFGNTQQRAARYFIHSLAGKFRAPRAEIARGPEGQIVVYYPIAKASIEKQLRLRMSEVSYEVLDNYGVWIVGLPTKPEDETAGKPLKKAAKRR